MSSEADSDEENENFCFYGKPLEPYDEDAFPKKKPIAIEEQIATDAQGRRRFHGAFQGGFSAGFYNTCGSLEGFEPQEFRSTRQDRQANRRQKPQDFMDAEDLGEHGIAPETVKATKEYSTAKKRHRKAFADGPIPGEPVLHSILTSSNETVGYLLLKNIGIDGKTQKKESETTREYKIPEIYKEYLEKPKTNTFGLGYKSLSQSHINLFSNQNLVVLGKNNEKMTISGKAFGVGAFEDEDEDIYHREDMSRYDFELTKEKNVKKKIETGKILDLFVKSKQNLVLKKCYKAPKLPQSFTGKYKQKKSRFEPIVEEENKIERKDINPEIRAELLGEPCNKQYTASKAIKEPKTVRREPKLERRNDFETASKPDLTTLLMSDKFVSASNQEDLTISEIESQHGTNDQREAVKMKLFGPLTRSKEDWYPNSLLCKRFNVPEPILDKSELQKDRKRTKNLIFEYQKHADKNEELTAGLNMKNEEKVEDLPEKQQEEEIPSTSQQQQKEEIHQPAKDLTEEKINVEQNTDLFKAIFLDSDSDESDQEQKDSSEQEATKQNELRNQVLSDDLLPKLRPLRQGILSNVQQIVFKKPSEREKPAEKVELEEESLCFGPKLPERLPLKVCDAKIDESSDDEWIEKTSKKEENHKKKPKKKHKKHKKKHKKDKH